MLLVFSACDEDPTDALQEIIKEDLGYVPRITSFTLVTPASTTVPVGSSVTFDLRYWSEGSIKDIQFWMIQGATETRIAEQNYAPAFSKITRTDSLRFTYQIPGTLDAGSQFSVQARVANVGLETYPAKSALLNFTLQ